MTKRQNREVHGILYNFTVITASKNFNLQKSSCSEFPGKIQNHVNRLLQCKRKLCIQCNKIKVTFETNQMIWYH